MKQSAIEVQGKVFLNRCLIRRNYSGVCSQKDSSVIIKGSNVSGNVNRGLIQESGGRIGRHLTYEGLVPLLNLQHKGWKVAGALVGVSIGLYATKGLVGFVQYEVLATRSQIKALEEEREALKDEMIQQKISSRRDQQDTKETQDKEVETLKQDKAKLEAEKQSLQERLNNAQKQPAILPSPVESKTVEPEPIASPVAEEESGEVWGREAFRNAVMGKTAAQVQNAVGSPKSTSDGYRIEWKYQYKTKDPANGKTDFSATLVFEKGVVKDVSFYGG